MTARLDPPESFGAFGALGTKAVSTLASRRDALVDQAVGRVLHLGAVGRSSDDVLTRLAEPSLGQDGEDGPSFDTVISVLAITTAPDPVPLLDLLTSLVAPCGRLLMLEATRPPERSVASRLSAGLGRRRRTSGSGEPGPVLRTDLDIPTMVRDAGFGPVVVERFGPGDGSGSPVFVSLVAGRRSELRPLDHAAETGG